MKIAICEDVEDMRLELSALLTEACVALDITIVVPELYASAEDLLAAMAQGRDYDLLFLDIELGALSGMEAAAHIRAKNHQTELIFVTSHQNYMPHSFSVEAFEFLIKPVQAITLQAVLARFVAKYQSLHHEFPIQTATGLVVLSVNEMVYLSSNGKMLNIYTRDGKCHTTRQKISDAERALAPWHFVRIHHGYLINLAYIQEITTRQVGSKLTANKELITKPLANGQSQQLPISRQHYTTLHDAFLRYKTKGGQAY